MCLLDNVEALNVKSNISTLYPYEENFIKELSLLGKRDKLRNALP